MENRSQKQSDQEIFYTWGIKENACLHSTSTCDWNKWHTRLEHVNMETIKSMIQRELVMGIPHVALENKICGSYLHGKQKRDECFRKQPHTEQPKYLNLYVATFVVP